MNGMSSAGLSMQRSYGNHLGTSTAQQSGSVRPPITPKKMHSVFETNASSCLFGGLDEINRLRSNTLQRRNRRDSGDGLSAGHKAAVVAARLRQRRLA